MELCPVWARLSFSPETRRVLIVEDCLEDRLLLELAFEDAAPGVQVRSVADDGAALVECCSPTPPHVVLLDLHLPGQDGLEVLLQLRTQTLPAVQVVCWSSHAHPTEVDAVLRSGALAYVEKPQDGAGFLEVVRTLLTL